MVARLIKLGLVGLLSFLAVICICAPALLGDDNGFLKGFVNHEFLGFMGVLVTITLASAANIHIELNNYEDRIGREVFF